jgi:endonuclease YncB( thermonuclease family)
MARKSSVLEFRRPRRRYVAPGPVRGNKLRFSQKGAPRARVIGPAGGLAAGTVACLLLLAGIMLWELQATPGKPDLKVAGASPSAPARETYQDRQHTSYGASLPVSLDRAAQAQTPVNIRWVDGDSGWINGREFRLYGVDAPEGSPSRADCQAERARSARAKDAARSLTSKGNVEIRGSMGIDRYGRDLLLLTVDGKDVAASLVGRGHLQYWAYEAGQDKPDWCG